MKTSRSSLTVLAALLLAGSLSACDTATTGIGSLANPLDSVTSAAPAAAEPSVEAPAAATPAGAGAEAAAQLATLPVKGRAPKTGYSRDEFGPAWSDVDRNGCDTRNDMLRRDLTDITVKPGTKDCVIASGTLADKYTGTTIEFVRGPNSGDVQIDHVVALNDAWQKGAQQLSAEQRLALANDPLNLWASQGSANMSKGAGDAATWLPSNTSFRCEYVARQTAVKAKYNLWVTQAEHDAIAGILATCK